MRRGLQARMDDLHFSSNINERSNVVEPTYLRRDLDGGEHAGVSLVKPARILDNVCRH